MALMRLELRRPASLSQDSVCRLPTTRTGSPLLMLRATLPPSSPQQATSIQRGAPSTKLLPSSSHRREVEAIRKLVTDPLAVRLWRGTSTTLPTTWISVSYTVLLGVLVSAPATCRAATTVQRGAPSATALQRSCGP